uniref:Isoform 2 of Zinc finger and BTB domain-containing protein 40 n=1 Tax=Homo sapiens TaxID=9606 RepID=Q9NUA8-2|nr:unnamed protein product [Homo sapiens]
MELPNYSRQLLQQLYTLCKEQQFCDCTISIGTIYFRAHKLVLAAASLLFKTLLDNTDTISIDASVVSPEEFALLLEMMYTGKLPVGKHNFSKIISLADSLQMFDVAVSCKNLLTSLAATPGGPVKAETEEAAHSVSQEMSVNSPTAQESQRNAETPAETPTTAEACSPSPAVQTFSEAKKTSTEPGCERKHYQLNFLLENEGVFSDALMVTQDVLKKLEMCSNCCVPVEAVPIF